LKKPSHSLEDSVTTLNGVGVRIEEKLNRLNIYTIKDILFHLPYRYIDRTRLVAIGALQAGTEAYIQGEIELAQVKYGRRRSLLCRISDGTGGIILRFFHFSRAQQNALVKGKTLRCYGPVRFGANCLEMVHPEYRIVEMPDKDELEQTLTPVYPATEGLQQNRLRNLTRQALALLERADKDEIELLPATLLQELKMMDLICALQFVHRPPPNADTLALQCGEHIAQKRLSFEELLAHHLSLIRIRKQYQAKTAAAFTTYRDLLAQFMEQLPFTLTNAQQRAFESICRDLEQHIPMLRLLQGDVGSGKTVVAALSSLQAIAAGYQVALMAPTELLAEQHFNTFRHWFEPLSIPVIYLSGKLNKSSHNEQVAQLAENKPLLAVGTHALFQDNVYFNKLGLAIIDEQHRFGVKQRLALLEKGNHRDQYPHQLIMTATPIPRTLAMTAYADLDISVIDELPPQRQKISTVLISNKRRDEIIERIAQACKQCRQVYWVCTLIEESDSLSCQAAIDTQLDLQQKLPFLKIGLVHGRMSSDDKEREMSKFKAGKLNILVATTVIEVGVDVPDASLMIIENAERLGLAQLHQLRGRIGRGTVKSDCVLMYQPPLSEHARNRLYTMRNTTNGFEIAEKDLELRGPGELLGKRQTGLPELRIADLIRDKELLHIIQSSADMITENYPQNIDALIRRWLGHNMNYSNV